MAAALVFPSASLPPGVRAVLKVARPLASPPLVLSPLLGVLVITGWADAANSRGGTAAPPDVSSRLVACGVACSPARAASLSAAAAAGGVPTGSFSSGKPGGRGGLWRLPPTSAEEEEGGLVPPVPVGGAALTSAFGGAVASAAGMEGRSAASCGAGTDRFSGEDTATAPCRPCAPTTTDA